MFLLNCLFCAREGLKRWRGKRTATGRRRARAARTHRHGGGEAPASNSRKGSDRPRRLSCGLSAVIVGPPPYSSLSPARPRASGPPPGSSSPLLRRSGRQRSGAPPAAAAPPLHPPKARPSPQGAVARRPWRRPILAQGGLLSFAGGACRFIRRPSALRSGGCSGVGPSVRPARCSVLPTLPGPVLCVCREAVCLLCTQTVPPALASLPRQGATVSLIAPPAPSNLARSSHAALERTSSRGSSDAIWWDRSDRRRASTFAAGSVTRFAADRGEHSCAVASADVAACSSAPALMPELEGTKPAPWARAQRRKDAMQPEKEHMFVIEA